MDDFTMMPALEPRTSEPSPQQPDLFEPEQLELFEPEPA